MKEEFYIFLNVDGVMYDWQFIKEKVIAGEIENSDDRSVYKPESVQALNHLISALESDGFAPKIVLTEGGITKSTKDIVNLYKNGLEYEGKFGHTKKLSKKDNKNKSRVISEFMTYVADKNATDNMLVIDNNTSIFDDTIDSDKMITTKFYDGALSHDQIVRYIKALEKERDL